MYLSFSLPFVVWILSGFFQGLPVEVEEAGLGGWRTRLQVLRLIVIPMAMPGLIAAGVFSFVLAWNEFLFAFILTGIESRTLPVALDRPHHPGRHPDRADGGRHRPHERPGHRPDLPGQEATLSPVSPSDPSSRRQRAHRSAHSGGGRNEPAIARPHGRSRRPSPPPRDRLDRGLPGHGLRLERGWGQRPRRPPRGRQAVRRHHPEHADGGPDRDALHRRPAAGSRGQDRDQGRVRAGPVQQHVREARPAAERTRGFGHLRRGGR